MPIIASEHPYCARNSCHTITVHHFMHQVSALKKKYKQELSFWFWKSDLMLKTGIKNASMPLSLFLSQKTHIHLTIDNDGH